MRIVCRVCGTTLGEYAAGYVVICHRGREIVADSVVAVRCEKCRTVWKPATEHESSEPVVLRMAS